MISLSVQDYKPKNGQDPAVFNAMYMDYISKLNSDSQSTTTESPGLVSERPYSQKSSAYDNQSKYEDRNDNQEEDASQPMSKQPAAINDADMNMIDISACEFP